MVGSRGMKEERLGATAIIFIIGETYHAVMKPALSFVLAPPHGRHPRCHTFDKRKSHYGKTDDMRDFVSVNGGGNCSVAAARDAMGIDWMNKNELNEAIPPIYTQFIGEQLMAQAFSSKHVRSGSHA